MVAIPYHITPSGPPSLRFATASAEANSVVTHCACAAGMGRKVGPWECIQV